MKLDGEDGRPAIYNRKGEFVTVGAVRRAIMGELRDVASVYSLEDRSAAVDRVVSDTTWLRRCNGQFLGATARDGFRQCFNYLPAVGAT